MGNEIVELVDQEVQKALASGHRAHLGASVIGKPCARAAWYTFRWVHKPAFDGRMHRLFDRGHQEEHRFNRFFRLAGYEIRDYATRLVKHEQLDQVYMNIPWDEEIPVWYNDVSSNEHEIMLATAIGDGPKQWSFSEHCGHYGGSSDGKIRGPHLPPGWGGLEYKTHSLKSFNKLAKTGVALAKPEHNVQMQEYMYFFDLPWTLYVAVNKNNDELYCEVVQYREDIARRYCKAAGDVVEARTAPKRLSEDPSFFSCKHYCDFYSICHGNASAEKNCRSCQFAVAGENKSWYCNAHHSTIPEEFIAAGCESWVGIK